MGHTTAAVQPSKRKIAGGTYTKTFWQTLRPSYLTHSRMMGSASNLIRVATSWAMKLFAHIKMKIPWNILSFCLQSGACLTRILPQHVQNLSVGLYSEQHVGDCDVLELAFLGVWKVDLETEVEMSKIRLFLRNEQGTSFTDS